MFLNQLYLLYLFIAFSIGIISLAIAVLYYLKTRETWVRYYLYFHLSLTVAVVADLLSIYISINLLDIHRSILRGLDYLNVFIAKYAMMVTFPVFIHSFYHVPQAKKRNLILPGHDQVEVPIIEKRTAQVLSISGDMANVMDSETYETFDMQIPEELKGQVLEGSSVLYWDILGDKVMKQVKSGE